ncbi:MULTISPECIES: TIM-barrel domain-containing protein [unclassified Fusibacter]|uniref:glycoside hydrolase family 31 protein n=1 Tax=unclassified Fusibacter TaxID=2624464 RepID=UPI0013E93E81|nr:MULTISPECIES: TIM-barrel domain-containing protein [unclassified Fusibacter]MCK8059040.1 DUF5110 domain-containing protein [Fusibacter sp. A2]NPE22451.1 glycoside hydrolase family 31 protein [Fusibacter sp. A1]
MKKHLLVLLFILTLSLTACSLKPQPTSVNEVVEPTSEQVVAPAKKQTVPVVIRKNGNEVSFAKDGVFVFISWLTDDAFQISFRPGGAYSTQTEVVGRSSFDRVDYELVEEENIVTMTSSKLKVVIDYNAMTVAYYNAQGELLLEQLAYDAANIGEFTFNHTNESGFYGLDSYGANETSERAMFVEDGGRVLAGQQGDAGAPFIWSKKFGLLFDSTSGDFKIDDTTINFDKHNKVDSTYYVIVGNPIEIMTRLYSITGTAPMFPKWAMGFTNSEWGMDQKELTDIITTYREKELPIDNYTLDFDWKAWGEDNYGEFRWNDQKFPDGSSGAFAKEMESLGLHLTGIFKPRILTETIQGEYARKQGYFYPNQKDYREYFSGEYANDIDFSNDTAGAWYFNNVKQAIDTGIAGYWNDEADELGDNIQHLNMQKALYLGQRGYNDVRVWSINRNFFLGAQRYAYGLWSGDIYSGFEAMAKQRETMLTAINLGQAKWGMDTGGFNGPDPTPENYTRWVQMSAFTPIFRVHSTENRQRQPWVFGETAEARSREVMNIRYQLTPYVYSYERRAYDTGLGLVTPIFYHQPDNSEFDNYIGGWYFGDHLVYYPVVEEGASTLEVTLPNGDWYHYQTGEKFEGGKHTLTADNKDWSDVNLFIKEGAILPKQPIMQYMDEYVVNDLSVEVFPSDKQTSFTVYDDDGKTYAYENRGYFKQTVTQQKDGDSITIILGQAEGEYQTNYKTYTFTVLGEAKQVTADGKAVDFKITQTPYGTASTFKIDAATPATITIKSK